MPAQPGEKAPSLRLMLAYNPESGRFSQAGLMALRGELETAGHEVGIVDSLQLRGSGPARPTDLVCIVGGDGTARTVIGRDRRGKKAGRYCIYPAGSANLVAREAGYPRRASAFRKRIEQGTAGGRYYLGQIGDEVFLCCASIGPDSAAVARVTPALKKRFGRLAYVLALAGQLLHWPRQRFAVTLDGETFAAEAVFVCKGRHYAGPWTLDGEADLRHDYFRVLLLDRCRRRDFLRLVLSGLVHPRLADAQWIRRSARTVEVSGIAGLPVQADGDILTATPARFTIAPEPVAFL